MQCFIFLFIFDSPTQWLVVIVAFALLFGAKRLPELAKSIGQAKREFAKGMAEEDENAAANFSGAKDSSLAQIDNETLLAEIRRREAKRAE